MRTRTGNSDDAGSPPLEQRRSWMSGAAVAAVFAGVTVAQLFRQTGVPSWKTVWAEDGRVFYSGTQKIGDLLAPHAGYMQLTSRLIGWAAHAVPIEDVAWFYAFVGVIVTSLAALAVWHFAGQLVHSLALRAVLALQVVLLPATLLEQVANGVNTLWAVLFAGWWALVYRPRSARAAIAPAALAFVAACSSGLALLYLPFAALLAWKRRERPSLIVCGAFAVGSVFQVLVSLQATDETVNGAHRVGDLPGIFSIRVLASMLVGEQWVDDVWSALGWSLGVIAGVAFVAVFAALARRTRGDRRCLGLIAVGYAVFTWTITLWGRGTVGMRIGREYTSLGNRYSVLAIWFLTSGLVILLAGARVRASVKRAGVILVVAQFVVVAVAGFRGPTPRSSGPEWEPSIAVARRACREHRVKRASLAVVPFPFDVVVACDALGS